MKLRQRLLLIAALMFAGLASGSAQTQLRPGQYETTAELTLGGFPTGPVKDLRCIPADEVKDFPKLIMRDVQVEVCKVSDLKTTANKVTFNTACAMDGVRYTSMSEVTFSSDSFAGVTKTTTSSGQVNLTKISGKRVGECSLATGSAQIQLRPGQYEVTADMDFAGTKMTEKDSDCITAGDLKDFSNISKLFMEADEEKSCKVSDYKVSGNNVTFNSICETDGLKMISTAEMTFATESFTGLMTMKDNKGRTTTIKTTAKRIGECKK